MAINMIPSFVGFIYMDEGAHMAEIKPPLQTNCGHAEYERTRLHLEVSMPDIMIA